MSLQTLSSYLYTWLGIQEGEVRKTLLMCVNIFLIIASTLIVKPIANGLFLAKFGIESLPLAYLFVAVAAGAVSYVYTRILRKYSVVRIFRLTFLFSIFSLLLFGLSIRYNVFEGLVLYLLYVWIAIFALLATSQFWIIANFVCTQREAKRLFGLIGAGGIAGAIFGGYLTSIMANFLESEYLLFVCALFLLICIRLTELIWRTHVSVPASDMRRQQPSDVVATHPFLLIRRSRHLSYMAAIAFTGVLVAKLIDYQFGGLAVAAITDPDELTAFFGFWFSTFNVISLLVQLFVTSRVVGTFGVGSSLFFLPSFVLMAAGVLLVFPELLMAAVFLKMTDASLKQSVNKAAMELLILPVPNQIKNQTKTFIDVVIDSIATGVSGLLLIFIIQGLNLPTWVVTVLILVFALVWMRLAVFVRKEYVRTFSKRIEEASGSAEKKPDDPFDFSKASVLEGLRKVLRKGSDTQIIFVIRKLRDHKESRLYSEVLHLLDHQNDQVVVEVLRYLSVFRRNLKEIRDRIEPLMYSGSQAVKIEAFEYLIRLEFDQRGVILEKYLSEEDYRVRIAAMVSLARESRTNPELSEVFRLHDMIRERYNRLASVTDPVEERVRRQGILQAMGYTADKAFFPDIEMHLTHGDADVRRAAFAAAGRTRHPSFIAPLLKGLSSDETRDLAINALVNYGATLMPFLKKATESGEYPVHTVKAFPEIASLIPSRESLELCFSLLNHEDAEVRQEAISALSVLKENYPDYKVDRIRTVNEIRKEARLYQDTLSILYAQTQALAGEEDQILQARQRLVGLLEKKLDADLETIFQLLGLHYASEEILSVYKVIRSDMRDTRTDALEFLENLLDPNLKRVLLPIIESAMWDSITEEAIRKMKIRIPDAYTCYQMILQGEHRKLKQAVLNLFRQLQDTRYLPLIEKATRDADQGIRDYAKKTRDFL